MVVDAAGLYAPTPAAIPIAPLHLFLETVSGFVPMSERAIRRVVCALTWADQKALFLKVCGQIATSP